MIASASTTNQRTAVGGGPDDRMNFLGEPAGIGVEQGRPKTIEHQAGLGHGARRQAESSRQ